MSENLVLPKSESPQMFNRISRRYDLLNRILSLGQDVHWRNRLKDLLPARSDLQVLDIASGTADVLITLAQDNPNFSRGVGVDLSVGMLQIGQQKLVKAGLDNKVMLQEADAQKLPFMENAFDVVTISFGIRNIPDLRLALLEMHRVAKSGGTVMILEFSKPSNPLLAWGHWFYMNFVVPVVGFLFSGNFKAYRYLNQTVQTFPYGERFCRILKQFGFIDIQAIPLMGGVATIYAVKKP